MSQKLHTNGATNATEGLDIKTALTMACMREAAKLEACRLELQELSDSGVYVPIDAPDLLRLERAGFVLDFDSGLVMEVDA